VLADAASVLCHLLCLNCLCDDGDVGDVEDVMRRHCRDRDLVWVRVVGLRQLQLRRRAIDDAAEDMIAI
jgi:hypothetical protein